MGRNYEQTHENIIENARRLFLEKGYERTNLRQICSLSGVTNGAFYRHFKSKEDLFSSLVDPCVAGMKGMYSKSEEECFQALSKNSVSEAMKISGQTVISLIDYIYENFDAFKLLIMCSDGTSYSGFIERIVALEVGETMKFFDEAKRQGIEISLPGQRSVHMLSHCYFNTIFECVVHDYEKEDTLGEVTTLVEFFNAGWTRVLGL